MDHQNLAVKFKDNLVIRTRGFVTQGTSASYMVIHSAIYYSNVVLDVESDISSSSIICVCWIINWLSGGAQ